MFRIYGLGFKILNTVNIKRSQKELESDLTKNKRQSRKR